MSRGSKTQEPEWVYSKALKEVPEVELLDVGFSTFDLYKDGILEGNKIVMINRVKVSNDVAGTIYDPRLGFKGSNTVCSTCNLVGEECGGHLGLIKLNQTVISPLHIGNVIKILSIICRGCGDFILNPMEIKSLGITELSSKNRLDVLVSFSKGKKCLKTEGAPGKRCIDLVPYQFSNSGIEWGMVMYKEQSEQDGKFYPFSELKPMLVKDVANILDIITDKQAAVMGFDVTETGAHPRNAILNYMIVIPPCSRTNNIVNGVIESDKIGNQYEDIIKINNSILEIKKKKKKSDVELNEAYKKLYSHIRDLIYKSESSAHLQSVATLIQGKKGILRNNIFGYRVDFSGRSVASHTPDLKFWQVGIPAIMARNLTIPITINNENKEELNALLRQGKVVSLTPSERSILNNYSNKRIRVDKKIMDTYRLTNGDIVHRWLQNGDPILVNRQPTLHKYSIMGFEAYILPPGQETIQVNIKVTTPFNLDFDGDELNIHVPQAPEAQEEARTVMNVRNCIQGTDNNLYIKLVYKSIHTVADMTRDPPNETIISLETLSDAWEQIGTQRFFNWIQRIMPTNESISRAWVELNLRVNRDVFTVMLSGMDLDAEIVKEVGTSLETETDNIKLVNLLVKHRIIPPATLRTASMVSTSREGSFRITGKELFSIVLPENFPTYDDGKVVIKNGLLIKGVITASTIKNIQYKVYHNYGSDEYIEFLDDIFRILLSWQRTNTLSVGIKDCMLTDPDSKIKIAKRLNKIRTEVRELQGRLTGNPIEDSRIKQKIVSSLSSFISSGSKIVSGETSQNKLLELERTGAKGNISNIIKITSGIGQIFTQGGFPECKMTRGSRYSFYQARGDDSLEWGGFCTGSLMEGLDPNAMYYLSLAGIEGLLKGITKTPTSGDLFRQLRTFLQSVITNPDGSVRDDNENIIQGSYGNNGLNPTKTVIISSGEIKKQFFVYIKDLAEKNNFSYEGEAVKLTQDQIQDIVDNMPFVKNKFSEGSKLETANLKAETAKLLTEVIVKPNALDSFSKKLASAYTSRQAPYNTMAGSNASEALIGDLTQDALDGKKNTGVSKTKIVPLDRLREIITLTVNSKDPKTRVYFTGKQNGYNEFRKYETKIVSVTLKDLTVEHTAPEDPENYFGISGNNNSWYETYSEIYETAIPKTKFFLRMTLDVNIMYKFKITPSKLLKMVKEGTNDLFTMIISPVLTSAKNKSIIYLDLYPNQGDIMKIVAEEKGMANIKKFNNDIVVYIFLNNTFLSKLDDIIISGVKNIRYLDIDSVDLLDGIDVTTEVKRSVWRIYKNWGWINYNLAAPDFIERMLKESNIKILVSNDDYIEVSSDRNPIIEISNTFKKKLASAKEYSREKDKEKEKLFQTGAELQSATINLKPSFVNSGEDTLYRIYRGTLEGNNLSQLLLLNFIDPNRTFSYDIHEMYHHFGIGAARNLIIIRLTELFKSVPIWVDPRHILLLADYMCFPGYVNKIGYSGVQKRGGSFIQSISIGNQMKTLVEVGFFGKIDPLKSAQSSVMTGRELRSYRTEEDVSKVEKIERIDMDDMNDFLENLDMSTLEDAGNLDDDSVSLKDETPVEETENLMQTGTKLPASMIGGYKFK